MATNNRAKEGAAANSPSNGQDAPNAAEAIAEDELTQPSEVVVEAYITVRDLARLIGRSPIDLIKILMQYGIMAPITHSLDHDTAVILGEELKVKVKWPESEAKPEAEAAREFLKVLIKKEEVPLGLPLNRLIVSENSYLLFFTQIRFTL